MNILKMNIATEKIQYRRADLADIDILIDFRITFLNEFYSHDDYDEEKTLRTELKEYFDDKIKDDSFVTYLAIYKNSVVGTGSFVVWSMPPKYSLQNGKLAYILNMYILPEMRRMGIGSRILEDLIIEAKSKSITYLHLHSSIDGLNIYKKVGFELVDNEYSINL